MRKVASACFSCCVNGSDPESDVGSYFEYVVHNHYIYKMKMPRPEDETSCGRPIFRRRKRRGIHSNYHRYNMEGDLQNRNGPASVRNCKQKSYPKDVYGEARELSSEYEEDWDCDRFSDKERSLSPAKTRYSATTSPYCNEDSVTPGDQTHDSNSASDPSGSLKHNVSEEVKKINKKKNFTSLSSTDPFSKKTLLRRI